MMFIKGDKKVFFSKIFKGKKEKLMFLLFAKNICKQNLKFNFTTVFGADSKSTKKLNTCHKLLFSNLLCLQPDVKYHSNFKL